MVVRIWKAPITCSDREAFRRFEREMLELLQGRPGLLGAFFRQTPGAEENTEMRASMSIWEDRRLIDAIEASSAYRRLMEKIDASGVLRGPSESMIFETEPGVPIHETFAKALG